MAYFISFAKEKNKKTAMISTSQHANSFFKKYGAREIAFIENGWGRGMHKIDMCIYFWVELPDEPPVCGATSEPGSKGAFKLGDEDSYGYW